MQKRQDWVALAALAALCAFPARLSPGIQYAAAVAAESSVPKVAAASASSPASTPALDEMLLDANGQRQHWTSVPNLVVLTSVMEYHSGQSTEYVASSEPVSAEDTKSLVADLTGALRLLTNNAFDQFATIEYQTVAAGSSVTIVRPKQIVVGRYQGLQRRAQTIGFGGRQARRDGAIISAAILLDSEFDRTSASKRLLRTHELGHALGFNHVKSRQSIMNPRIGPEVTAFDRQVVMLAFQRPGSRPAN